MTGLRVNTTWIIRSRRVPPVNITTDRRGARAIGVKIVLVATQGRRIRPAIRRRHRAAVIVHQEMRRFRRLRDGNRIRWN